MSITTIWELRQGTKAELDAITLASGEPGYTTDTKNLYIGDGATNSLVNAVVAGNGVDVTLGTGTQTIDLDLKSNGGLVIEGVNNELALDLGATSITNSLAEAKVTFNITTGHDHDGADSKKITYSNLDSIPSAFTPTAHTQAESTITFTNSGGHAHNGTTSTAVDHTNLSNKGTNTHSDIDNHISATGSSVHGLGTISTQASNNVSITGGAISGITDLAIADGGTGAGTAAAARTALGLDPITDADVVGGRLDLSSATALKWSFLFSNQIRIYNSSWEVVKLASEPTMANTVKYMGDAGGTALEVDKVLDIFAEYSSATAITLIASRWATTGTGGGSARTAAYNSGTAYAQGDRVTSGGKTYCCIQAGTNKDPSSEPTYWNDNGTTVAGDFDGLYQKDGVWVSSSGAAGLKRRWLGIVYTHNNSATVNFKDDLNYRYISNHYNRIKRNVDSSNSNASWTYTTATRRECNGGTGQTRGQFVLCKSVTSMLIQLKTVYICAGGGWVVVAPGLNSTTSATRTAPYNPSVTCQGVAGTGYSITPPVGYNYITEQEQGDGTNANTIYGGSGGFACYTELML